VSNISIVKSYRLSLLKSNHVRLSCFYEVCQGIFVCGDFMNLKYYKYKWGKRLERTMCKQKRGVQLIN
jgi:hypothetical protein